MKPCAQGPTVGQRLGLDLPLSGPQEALASLSILTLVPGE